MMTNNPNANLIEAMKEKLPLKGQLADMLMDTLYIGKEAVYRRLRGEVPFTLQESALISRKLGISLDKIIGLSFKSNAMFNINIVDYDDPFESYYNILEKYVSLISMMPDDPNSVMGTSANIIPQTLYLKHELLAKFRLFKWMYQNKYIDCKSFEELEIPTKLANIQKDYVGMTRHIPLHRLYMGQYDFPASHQRYPILCQHPSHFRRNERRNQERIILIGGRTGRTGRQWQDSRRQPCPHLRLEYQLRGNIQLCRH